GGAGQGDGEEVLLGLLDALLDGRRHLLGLAVAEADLAVAVAHGHEGGEREAAPALDDLGHAVDGDHPLFVLTVAGVSSLTGTQDGAPVRTRGRPRGRHRPGLPPGRGRGTRPGRTRPVTRRRPWPARR